jgi:hypothetical protein
MKFKEVYRIVEGRNPMLKTGQVTMSSENFEKAMKWAYDRGQEDQGSANLFGSLFGSGVR